MHQLPPLPDHEPGSARVAARGFRTRRAIWAGAVVLALSGAGAATVWAATATPNPSPSATATPSPGQTGDGHHGDGPFKGSHPFKGAQRLHGEAVVKKADGTFQTVLGQRGKIESVSDTSITVKSEDGFSQQFAISADTRILRLPAVGADGKVAKNADGTRQKSSTIKASDLKSGDTVRVIGVKDGGNAKATSIVAGDLPTIGHGIGKMMGGRGHGMDHDDN